MADDSLHVSLLLRNFLHLFDMAWQNEGLSCSICKVFGPPLLQLTIFDLFKEFPSRIDLGSVWRLGHLWDRNLFHRYIWLRGLRLRQAYSTFIKRALDDLNLLDGFGQIGFQGFLIYFIVLSIDLCELSLKLLQDFYFLIKKLKLVTNW